MNSTVFRDLVLLMVMGFVAMVVWMVPFLNPPATDDAAEPPGNVIAHITWPEGNTDVDMWVTGPGEPRPVGYSNKGGALWNLLRDDLGKFPDATPLNYENAYTRGITPGEYVVNVHCYRCPVLPVKVQAEVSLKTDDGNKSSMRIIATTSLELNFNGEELTAMRFKLTENGEMVEGSLSHLFQPLRASQKGAP